MIGFILAALTLLFVGLKLKGRIGWPWWAVLLPNIVVVGGYLFLVMVSLDVMVFAG